MHREWYFRRRSCSVAITPRLINKLAGESPSLCITSGLCNVLPQGLGAKIHLTAGVWLARKMSLKSNADKGFLPGIMVRSGTRLSDVWPGERIAPRILQPKHPTALWELKNSHRAPCIRLLYDYTMLSVCFSTTLECTLDIQSPWPVQSRASWYMAPICIAMKRRITAHFWSTYIVIHVMQHSQAQHRISVCSSL